MPDNVKTLLVDAGKAATQYGVDITVQAEEDALKKMTAEGAEVIKFEDQEKVQAAVPNMIDIWIANMAKDGKKNEARAYVTELKGCLGMK